MEKELKLEQKLSPLNVWSLALGCIIGWGAFVMPGNTFLVKAGPLGTAVAMGAAVIIMIIISFNYQYLIQKYPVAGGEFTYTKYAFGTKHAFICSWFLGLSYLAIVPLNATALALIGRNLMNNVFQVGFHYTIAGYDVYFGEILLATVALLLFSFLSIRGVKFTGWFQTGLVFMLVGGVLIITTVAIFNSETSFSNLLPGFNPDVAPVSGILAVVAVAPWAFVGFDTIPQAAEEFRFSTRKTKIIMVLSILFGALVYVTLNTITAMIVPKGYTSWVDYMNNLHDMDGLLSLPTFHASYQLLGKWGLFFLGLAVLGAILSGIIGFYMATSRLFYSMSKERVLPEWFGVLHSRYKTPSNAILFIMAIALVAPIFGRTALGWIVDMSSIGAAVGYAYTSMAAFKFARLENNTNIMITGLMGTIFAFIFIVLLLVPIQLFNTSLGIESYICLVLWSILGILFYVFSVKRRF